MVRMSNADTPDRPDQPWQPPAGEPMPPFAPPSDSAWQPLSDSANPYGAPQPPHGAAAQPPYGAAQPPYGAAQPPFAAPAQPSYGAPADPGYGAPAEPPSAGSPYASSPQAPSGAPDPYAAQQPYPPAPPYAAQYGPPPAAPRQDANPLAALFDFGFTKFATPGIVKIVYLLSVVVAGLGWLTVVVSGFGMGRYAGGAMMGTVALLFGWIPALLFVAYMRFILEAIVAVIRIHDRVNEIAERDKGTEQS